MCNACGNACCGSDEFGGCGCDGCEEPECWSDDYDDDTDYFDDDYASDYGLCACRRPSSFRCVEISGGRANV